MGFKDWPSWLKGGVIVGVIFSCLSIVNMILMILIDSSNFRFLVRFDGLNFLQGIFFITPLLLFGIMKWDNPNPSLEGINGYLYGGLINLIFYFIIGFIIGALIGFIIGKLKSKNQQINQNNRVTKG